MLMNAFLWLQVQRMIGLAHSHVLLVEPGSGLRYTYRHASGCYLGFAISVVRKSELQPSPRGRPIITRPDNYEGHINLQVNGLI
jgi:hypothetical protein